ncbi:unnamed protein product [Phaeothamnion confervicola]
MRFSRRSRPLPPFMVEPDMKLSFISSASHIILSVPNLPTSQDTMNFAAVHSIRAHTIVFPFSKTTEAYNAMLDGKYRVVLDMTKQ